MCLRGPLPVPGAARLTATCYPNALTQCRCFRLFWDKPRPDSYLLPPLLLLALWPWSPVPSHLLLLFLLLTVPFFSTFCPPEDVPDTFPELHK